MLDGVREKDSEDVNPPKAEGGVNRVDVVLVRLSVVGGGERVLKKSLGTKSPSLEATPFLFLKFITRPPNGVLTF